MLGSRSAAIAAVIGLTLAGCSGMGAGSSTSGMPSTPSTIPNAPAAAPAAMTANTKDAAGKGNSKAIDAVNALGAPVKNFSTETTSESKNDGTTNVITADVEDTRGSGQCRHGVEFYSPDRAGESNSSETLDFYDAACKQLARDVVRTWTAGASVGSENVSRVVSQYADNDPTTPISVKNDTTTFLNGTYGKFGFPIVADGFERETSSDLVIGTAKNVLADDETVMLPSTTTVNNFCTDSAGYNSLSVSKSGLIYGWQGGAFGTGSTPNTRTQNADGSVTWSALHTGSTEDALPGGLSINKGTGNTACPITTPAYTLAGGMAKGTYTIPISVTFKWGMITNLTVTNATLSSGDTLNVTTNGSLWPKNPRFITGVVTNGTSQLAVFNVNGFGNGTLTVNGTGNQFVITDWNVVR